MPPAKKNGSTAVVVCPDPFNLWGNFPPSICLIKLSKVGDLRIDFFDDTVVYCTVFSIEISPGLRFFGPPKKPLLLGKGIYSLEKKHRFPQVFLKIHKSIRYLCPQWICRFLHHLFSPFHHAIHPATSRFACCLILLPQRYSFQLHVQPGRLWKGRVWGMEAHIPETWNIHLLMVLSIGWFRLI